MSLSSSVRLRWVLLAVFFLSGSSALIYQVVWMRMLTQVFGATVFAVATVITVFMAGLALGSYFFGRWVDRPAFAPRLLMIYALLEGGIGLYCLLTPWLFQHVEGLYSYIYSLADINFYLFSLIRFLFSLVILIVPTFLMGATLPLLGKFLVSHEGVIGRRLGVLYGVNTFGAVMGVLLASFVFIPVYGVKAALMIAVFINLGIAVMMLWPARAAADVASVVEVQPAEPPVDRRPGVTPVQSFVVLLVFALSGFAALGYEVVWFRVLVMTIGTSVYAFAIMLATFLLGLAVGSYIFSLFVDQIKNRLRAFAVLELLIGLSVLVLMPLVGKLPLLFLEVSQYFDFGFWAYQVVNFITAFIVIIIPAVLMGAVFPLVVRILIDGLPQLGRKIGSLYAVNTIGGVAGSFLIGFVSIPVFGLQMSIMGLATLNMILACVLMMIMPVKKVVVKAVVISLSLLVPVLGFLWPSGWDRHLMTVAVYYNENIYTEEFQRGNLSQFLRETYNIVYYKEGLTGTVSVSERHNNLSLAINGKVTADIRHNSAFNVILGGLPLMLHPQPRDALLVGLGSGMTLAAMARFPLKRITAVEISPEVVDANRLFSRYNGDVLMDPRVEMVVNDARSYMAYEDDRYDVIASEPSFPMMAGVGNLFTLEFYRTVKARLKPGGIMAQWLNIYGLKAEDMKLLMRTFLEVFPHATLWGFESGDFILLGTDRPLVLDYEQLAARMNNKAIGRMFRRIGIDSPEGLIAGLTMGQAALEEFVGKGGFNSYNRPRIEFAVPQNIYSATEADNYSRLVDFNPVAEISVSVPEGRRLSFMGLVDHLGDDWIREKTVYTINNIVAPDQAQSRGRSFYVYKDVAGMGEWIKKAAGLVAEQRLRVRSVSQRKSQRGGAVQRQLLASLPGRPVLQGQERVGVYQVYWALNRQAQAERLSFTWFCPLNGRSYIGELESAGQQSGQPVRPLLRQQVREQLAEIIGGLECLVL